MLLSPSHSEFQFEKKEKLKFGSIYLTPEVEEGEGGGGYHSCALQPGSLPSDSRWNVFQATSVCLPGLVLSVSAFQRLVTGGSLVCAVLRTCTRAAASSLVA